MVPKRARGQEAHPEEETRGSGDVFTFCLLPHTHRTMTLFPEAAPATLAAVSGAAGSSSLFTMEARKRGGDQQDVERVRLVLVEKNKRKQIRPRQRSFPEEQHSRMTFH